LLAILDNRYYYGIIGVGMSMLFRMQLAWPEESFKIFNILLGDKLLQWSYGK
jgi:hypothetical protein